MCLNPDTLDDNVFENLEIRDLNGSRRNISGSSFISCTFMNADFESSAFLSVTFRKCTFLDSSFNNADFRNATFDECSFKNTRFLSSQIRNSLFSACFFKYSSFDSSNFISSRINDSEILECGFSSVKAKALVISRSSLTSVNLRKTIIKEIAFDDTRLSDIYLSENLMEAKGASLSLDNAIAVLNAAEIDVDLLK